MYSMPIVRQYESRSTPRMSRSCHLRLAAEAAGDELAVEVPERQAVLDDVEVGVRALHVLERVGVGHQVAADAEGVDELLHAGGLVDSRSARSTLMSLAQWIGS